MFPPFRVPRTRIDNIDKYPRTGNIDTPYTYGLGQPSMKPHGMRVTPDLVSALGMLDKMQVLVRTCVLLSSSLLLTFITSFAPWLLPGPCFVIA